MASKKKTRILLKLFLTVSTATRGHQLINISIVTLTFAIFSVYVCLIDEYSSQEKCDKMAAECYETFTQERCVNNIRRCLAEHPGEQELCLNLAETCLEEGAEENVCVDQIPLCFANTEVVGEAIQCNFQN